MLTATRVALVALFSFLLACESSLDLVVSVRTDFIPGYEFVRAEVVSDALPLQEVAATGDEPWIEGVRVAEYSTASGESVRLDVRLFGREGELVANRPLVLDLSGSRSVTVTMSRTCAGVVCGTEGDELEACQGGRCVVASCVEPSDPTCPAMLECSDDSDCGATAECARSRCIESRCLDDVNPLACDPSTQCVPEVGCVPNSCDDREIGGAETDLDCGGPCPACSEGRLCANNSDCRSELCTRGSCALVDQCENGRQDENEEGADCGDVCARPCVDFRCDEQTDLPEPECQALLDLYHAAGGDAWVDHDDWFDNPGVCSFRGVVCEEGHVVELEVIEAGMAGVLPRGLDRLSALRSLTLVAQPDPVVRSDLRGALPFELGNLASLEELVISGHQLTGSIPEQFGALDQLRELDLSTNELEGPLPEALTELRSLRHLDLEENGGLSGAIPAGFGQLAELRSLVLAFNRFEGSLPPELGALSNLSVLNLRSNLLEGPIPEAFGDMSNLRYLDLRANRLTGPLPIRLWSIEALAVVLLHQNRIDGSIPTEVEELTNGEQLYLADNNLTGPVPRGLGRLQTRILNLQGNELTGTIPNELGNIVGLEILLLGGNDLTGEIPSSLGGLTELESLRLDENALSGSVPPELTSLSQLRSIDICPQEGELSADPSTGAWLRGVDTSTWPESDGC